MNLSILKNFIKEILEPISLIKLYSSRESVLKTYVALILMLTSGASEIAAITSLIPFIETLTEPSKLQNKPYTKILANWIDITDTSMLTLTFSIIFISVVLISSGIRLINLRFNIYLSAQIGTELSTKVFSSIINQPYYNHISRNTSEVINILTLQVRQTLDGLNAFFTFVTGIIISVVLVIGLIKIDGTLASVTLSAIVFSYLAVGKIYKSRLKVNGEIVAFRSSLQIKTIQETLNSFRDVVFNNSYEYFETAFSELDKSIRLKNAENQFIKMSPRLILEPIAMSIIILTASLSSLLGINDRNIIANLGIIAFGLQRLTPALQQIYSSWASLSNASISFKKVRAELALGSKLKLTYSNDIDIIRKPIITLKNLYYKYDRTSPGDWTLNNINLTINPGEIVGIIGSTGSGKSTLIDIIMGLLEANSGSLLINDNVIDKNKNPIYKLSWQLSIAHVPQRINLSDTSVLENIGFGIPKNEINVSRSRTAIKHAQLLSVIESLSNGIDTVIGENGTQLSGGQQQRLGIARALYKQSSILVLDEASSALDIETESAVLNSIHSNYDDMTVIMIAHRLASLKACTRIIKLNQGRIVYDGTPEEIITIN